MKPSVVLEAAAMFASGLVAREQARAGVDQKVARERVARRIGIMPGTLETLLRGRLKIMEAWVFHRLAAAAEADLLRQIGALQHELENARQYPQGISLTEAKQAEDCLAAAERSLAALKASNRRFTQD